MLTRIEITGFKTFTNFVMEFSPLTVIAGTNASGKSNLFDALQLLSRIAETDLRTAFGEQRGEARELFTQYDDEHYADSMSFKLEMLVDKTVRDNWGGEAELKYTRLRYEVEISHSVTERGMEELFVTHEQLEPLRHDHDEWVMRYLPAKTRINWRPKVITGKRGVPYIGTEPREGQRPAIVVPQDGKGGSRREFPLQSISQTIVSGFNSVDFPHVLAAKEEMRSWKFLQLNPRALREPTRQDLGIRDTITQQGDNLAAALHRIKLTDPFALKSIGRRLNNLLPYLTDVDVLDDKANKQFVIRVRSEDGREFSSRVLSEGTLRLLTLCVFQHDDKHKGLMCFEEPENGIHPARLREMAQLLAELSVDFANPESTPLRQVLVNTHSPVLVERFFDESQFPTLTVWLSQLVTRILDLPQGRVKLNVTKMLPVESEVRMHSSHTTLNFPEPERKMVMNQLRRYLGQADAEKTFEILGL
jgi:predicted ATPase